MWIGIIAVLLALLGSAVFYSKYVELKHRLDSYESMHENRSEHSSDKGERDVSRQESIKAREESQELTNAVGEDQVRSITEKLEYLARKKDEAEDKKRDSKRSSSASNGLGLTREVDDAF